MNDTIPPKTIQDEDPFIKHAALIMLQDRCKVGEARLRAWCEGPTGYEKRMKKQAEEAQE